MMREKKELMANAKCLLAPITWPEPFGLFMIEAMACGTPVIAYNRGAAPELVQDGETGYVVNSLDEMVDSVKKIELIYPMRCRQRVLSNFDVPVLAENYLKAYQNILNESDGKEFVLLAAR